MRMRWVAAIAACMAIASVDFVRAQGPHWGKKEYLLSCQPCHGTTGKGDGPTASHLTTRPADLTRLSESNPGVFPLARVFKIIDGRLEVAMHGPRAMPVWGGRYKRDVISNAPAGSLTDEGANLLARRRIFGVHRVYFDLPRKTRDAPLIANRASSTLGDTGIRAL